MLPLFSRLALARVPLNTTVCNGQPQGGDTLLMLLMFSSLLEFDRQIVHPVTFKAFPPLSKHLLWVGWMYG